MKIIISLLLVISGTAYGALSDMIAQTLPSTVIVVASVPAITLPVTEEHIIHELFDLPAKTRSFGTGFFINNYDIVTSHHVIEGKTKITITRYKSDVKEEAELVGYDEFADVALLRVKKPNLTHVFWGSCKDMRVGDDVFTVGHPFGYNFSAAKGIVSFIARRDDEFSFIKLMQTDVAINPGNSGGPLLNMDGNVIGLVRAIVSKSGGSDGISLSVKSEVVIDSVERIRKQGKVERASLGLVLALRASGLMSVDELAPKGVAEKQGIKVGDILLRINEMVVSNLEDIDEVGDFIQTFSPGDKLKFLLVRNGKPITLYITLGKIQI